jgi:hypothetical protein
MKGPLMPLPLNWERQRMRVRGGVDVLAKAGDLAVAQRPDHRGLGVQGGAGGAVRGLVAADGHHVVAGVQELGHVGDERVLLAEAREHAGDHRLAPDVRPAMREAVCLRPCRVAETRMAMRFAGDGDGASRTRTGDLLGAIQALSQLSYSPEVVSW